MSPFSGHRNTELSDAKAWQIAPKKCDIFLVDRKIPLFLDDLWLSGMQNRHTGENLPEGYVRENFYLCYEGKRLIGVFSLKFELTEFLLNYGGHIGYATRPSDRNRGLATQMLKQGLALSKEFGFERILCVCDNDNYASEKVILKNGGIFENELYDPNEEVVVKRFWICL